MRHIDAQGVASAQPRHRVHHRSLIAEALHDPELRGSRKRQLLDPHRAALRRCLPPHRAADRELIIGAVYGAVLYQLLLDEPLGAAFVRGVTRMVARLT